MSNVARVASLSFTTCIVLGLALVTVMSIGIHRAKTKRGSGYIIQVIGLIFSVMWTLWFVWKMAKVAGANQARNFSVV
jgi:hypothetical protein